MVLEFQPLETLHRLGGEINSGEHNILHWEAAGQNLVLSIEAELTLAFRVMKGLLSPHLRLKRPLVEQRSHPPGLSVLSLPSPFCLPRIFSYLCLPPPFAVGIHDCALRPTVRHHVNRAKHQSSSVSCCKKGLAICSLPSTGLMTTRRVPRATTRPRDRVDSFPSSSRRVSWTSSKTKFIRAS